MDFKCEIARSTKAGFSKGDPYLVKISTESLDEEAYNLKTLESHGFQHSVKLKIFNIFFLRCFSSISSW